MRNIAALQEDTVLPDTRLKQRFGKAEERWHYIDLEYFGSHPLDAIDSDISVTESRFGIRRVMRAGTLPWTIEAVAGELEFAWKRNDCERALLLSGYLSHYVGDLSQPLHTTRYFDGYSASDRGAHARIESAVNRSTRRISSQAAPMIHASEITSVWNATIAGLRQSHAHVDEVIRADRRARAASNGDRNAYMRAFMRDESALIANQIADSASRLASIWTFEWNRGGHPACDSQRSSPSDGVGARAAFLQNSH
jgi:hypothetical protein